MNADKDKIIPLDTSFIHIQKQKHGIRHTVFLPF